MHLPDDFRKKSFFYAVILIVLPSGPLADGIGALLKALGALTLSAEACAAFAVA
jgi:hypothetical protein